MSDDVTRTRQVTAIPGARRLARLVVLTGEHAGHSVSLDHDALVIGRSREADLRVDVEGVSRKHARITRTGNTLDLVDLGAKNGTYLNGERVEMGALHHGDRIQIADVVLQLLITDPQTADTSPSPTAVREPSSLEQSLSPREWEVALHVARGLTNVDIAASLGISRRTVATHLERIYERLGIHSRAALAHLVAGGGSEPG